jgi:hypothetical protein
MGFDGNGCADATPVTAQIQAKNATLKVIADPLDVRDGIATSP